MFKYTLEANKPDGKSYTKEFETLGFPQAIDVAHREITHLKSCEGYDPTEIEVLIFGDPPKSPIYGLDGFGRRTI